MIIDSHAHFVPSTLLEEIADTAADFPSLQLVPHDTGFGFSFAGSKPTRPVSPLLSDASARLDWMDQQQIDRQVIGGWLDMFGYEMPVEDGIKWSRLINKHLQTFAAASGGRFLPLASLPMQDGAAAASVLDDAHKAGFRGVMIGTQPKGAGGVLDDPELTPFWQAADRNKSVLFIHPVFDSGDSRVDDYGMNNAIGRITDTLIAISRLIYSGHVERYAGARIVIGIALHCRPAPELSGCWRFLSGWTGIHVSPVGSVGGMSFTCGDHCLWGTVRQQCCRFDIADVRTISRR